MIKDIVLNQNGLQKTSVLNWGSLNSAPEESGLYAWYYRPLLTEPDVHQLVEKLGLEIDSKKKQRIVSCFLEKHIFSAFKELPYRTELSGQLKPKFSGELVHQPTISLALLERIANQPETAWELKELFDNDLHFLSSPIYIGMAQNLKQRLGQHRSLIEEIRAQRVGDDSLEEDSAFANTVVSRELYPPHLSVCIQRHTNATKIANLENLLNRVFFPIFGRN